MAVRIVRDGVKPDLRGGILGREDDNGIFGVEVAPAILPEERRETLTCDWPGCMESRTVVKMETTEWRTGGIIPETDGPWLTMGDQDYCTLHAARMEEGCLGRQIAEDIFDGKEPVSSVTTTPLPPMGEAPMLSAPEPERGWLAAGLLTAALFLAAALLVYLARTGR